MIETGLQSQRKGKAGELELVSLLKEYGYNYVRRGKSLSYGKEPDASGLPGIHVEVKRRERLNLSKAMAQAVKDSRKFGDGFPAVFHRRNGEDWQVTMNLCDWIALYRKSKLEENEE